MCFGTGDKDNAKKWVAKGGLSELITFNDNFSIVKNVVERVRNYVAVSRLRQGIL